MLDLMRLIKNGELSALRPVAIWSGVPQVEFDLGFRLLACRLFSQCAGELCSGDRRGGIITHAS